MLNTAHMKSQLAKQSLTKNSERRSFGQRPRKSSRQGSQVGRASLPIKSPKHVSRASLPSKSSKQGLGWETCSEDLLERRAWCDWQTCLVCSEDLLGSLSSKLSNQALGGLRAAGSSIHRAGGPSVRGALNIYM